MGQNLLVTFEEWRDHNVLLFLIQILRSLGNGRKHLIGEVKREVGDGTNCVQQQLFVGVYTHLSQSRPKRERERERENDYKLSNNLWMIQTYGNILVLGD